MTMLFYRTGGATDFVWRLVDTTAADLPAKRLALFDAGRTTLLLPDGSAPPTTYEPPGAWGGKPGVRPPN
jgi:hypothetical protein